MILGCRQAVVIFWTLTRIYIPEVGYNIVRHGRISHVQSHVTVTYLVTRECHGVVFVQMTSVTKSTLETRNNHRFTCTRTRDRISQDQSHVIVTLRVTGERHSVDLSLISLSGSLNQ